MPPAPPRSPAAIRALGMIRGGLLGQGALRVGFCPTIVGAVGMMVQPESQRGLGNHFLKGLGG